MGRMGGPPGSGQVRIPARERTPHLQSAAYRPLCAVSYRDGLHMQDEVDTVEVEDVPLVVREAGAPHQVGHSSHELPSRRD